MLHSYGCMADMSALFLLKSNKLFNYYLGRNVDTNQGTKSARPHYEKNKYLNKVLTSFSPSPTHLLVKLLALKVKVHLDFIF